MVEASFPRSFVHDASLSLSLLLKINTSHATPDPENPFSDFHFYSLLFALLACGFRFQNISINSLTGYASEIT